MEDSLIRVLVWFVFTHTIHLIRVPPAVASKPHEKGNDHVKYLSLMAHLNIFGSYQLYHLYAYFGQPVTYYEYALLAVFLIGTVIRFWSYYALGKYFTFQIQVQEGQKIIKEGPYKYFAHPGYIGQFIMTTTSFMFYAIPWYLNGSMLLYVCRLFYYRIVNEEKMLREHFGPAYDAYRKTVW